MFKNLAVGKIVSLALPALLLLSSCSLGSYTVEIDEFSVSSIKNNEYGEFHKPYDTLVELHMKRSDFENILNKEFYISIDIFDCKNRKDAYPILPFFEGSVLEGFAQAKKKLLISENEKVIVYGGVDRKLVNKFSDVCVAISGGNYGASSVSSNILKLM